MILQKVATVLALSALATASVGDATSLCRIACASAAGSLGSSKMALSHHLSHSPDHAAMHHHMDRTSNSRSSALVAFNGMVALRLPQCAQYRQFAAFLSGAAADVTNILSARDAISAEVPAAVNKGTTKTTPLLTESPPCSPAPLLSTTSVLRI